MRAVRWEERRGLEDLDVAEKRDKASQGWINKERSTWRETKERKREGNERKQETKKRKIEENIKCYKI